MYRSVLWAGSEVRSIASFPGHVVGEGSSGGGGGGGGGEWTGNEANFMSKLWLHTFTCKNILGTAIHVLISASIILVCST